MMLLFLFAAQSFVVDTVENFKQLNNGAFKTGLRLATRDDTYVLGFFPRQAVDAVQH
jgi:hypothetical protein